MYLFPYKGSYNFPISISFTKYLLFGSIFRMLRRKQPGFFWVWVVILTSQRAVYIWRRIKNQPCRTQINWWCLIETTKSRGVEPCITRFCQWRDKRIMIVKRRWATSNHSLEILEFFCHLQFYVKSIFVILKAQNLLFWQFQHFWILV